MVWRERNFNKEISFEMCIYKDIHIYTKHSSPMYTDCTGWHDPIKNTL